MIKLVRDKNQKHKKLHIAKIYHKYIHLACHKNARYFVIKYFTIQIISYLIVELLIAERQNKLRSFITPML